MRSFYLVALLLAGCGSKSALEDTGVIDESDPGETSFPVGKYTRCARGTFTPDATMFLMGSGWEQGAALTLTRNGASVNASFLDAGGITHSLEFDIESERAANLSFPGQTVSGYVGLCPIGIGVSNEIPFDGALTIERGSLNHDAGTVFLALDGVLAGDSEKCGPQAVQGDMWLVCDHGPNEVPTEAVKSEPSALAVGQHTCTSQITTYYESKGLKQYVGSGGSGTLTLGASGTSVTASVGGSVFLSGTLQSSGTSPTTALANHDQVLQTPCEVPISLSGGLPPQIPEPFPIHAAALSQLGGMVFVSFAGTMGPDSSCPGAAKVGSLICNTLE